MKYVKMMVFDMDGTLANLYAVEDWLPMLRAYDATPYSAAKPMYDTTQLNSIISALKSAGWRIAITSWLSKESTPAYDAAVRKAKLDWLAAHGFEYDEIHLVKYGTTKADCTRGKADLQVLIDDNAKVRAGWHLGPTIDATQNILDALAAYVKED